ncbi:MAG: extracellular solute-binding protein [Clostridia bacterium]
MKRVWRHIALAAALTLCLSGCGGKTSNKATGGELTAPQLGDTYPVKTEETLTMWADAPVHASYASYKDQPFYQDLMKNTGINVDFRFPPQGQGQEAFNLLIASGNLPDVILYHWIHASGGPQKFLDEKYIIPLNDVFKAYSPNITKYLAEHPDADRMIKTDNGQYYCYPFLRGDDWLTVYTGPVVRQDLLEKYNIKEPVTLDDWHAMLTTFKDNGVKIPLTLVNNSYYLASGVNGYYRFYIDGSNVKYGPIEESWKDYINVMNRWYNEGLIDKDYGSLDSTVLNQKMASGDVGATLGSGSQIGTWMSSGTKNDPAYNLKGIKYPVPQAGMQPEFGQKDNIYPGYGCAAITTSCKNLELAAKFLDYFYTEEGQLFSNFGTEGVSYEMKDGQPVFTQAVFDDNGAAANIGKYAWSYSTTLSIQDRRMYEQRLSWDQQKKAIDVWNQTNMASHLIPPVLPNSEEVSVMADITSQLQTYMEEFFYSSVCSKEPLSDEAFQAYVEQVKALGVDRVISIYETAIGRYNQR